MGQLESLLAQVPGLSGEGITIESDQPVVMHTADGRDLIQPWRLSSAEINDALGAVLDEQQQVELMVGNLIEFTLATAGHEWKVLCEPRQEGIRLRARLNKIGKKSTRRGPGVDVPELTFDAAAPHAVPMPAAPAASALGLPSTPSGAGAGAGSAAEGMDLGVISGLADDFAFVPSPSGRQISDTAVPVAHDDDPFSSSFSASTASRSSQSHHALGAAPEYPDLDEASLSNAFGVEDGLLQAPPAREEAAPTSRPPSSPQPRAREASAEPAPAPARPDQPTRNDLKSVNPSEASEVDAHAGPTGTLGDSDQSTGQFARQSPRPDSAPHGTAVLRPLGAPTMGAGISNAAMLEWGCQPRAVYDTLRAAIVGVEAGTLCIVHRDSVLPCVESESPLCFVDEDDPRNVGDVTRGRPRGTPIVLAVDDLPRWLDWILRRLEEGHRVFVETRALSPDGAMRALLGSSPGRRAELWLAVHPTVAVVPEVGGFRIWSLTWHPRGEGASLA